MSDADCDLCGNFRELVEILYDHNKTVEFLEKHVLIATKAVCESCGSELSINKNFSFRCDRSTTYSQDSGKRYVKKRCRFQKSALKGSFFEGAHLSIRKVLELCYWFTLNRLSKEEVRQQLGIGLSHTVVDWFGFSGEVLIYYYAKKSVPLGGPGVIVELDEAMLCMRKYNKERVIEGTWIFGGIERCKKSVFMVPAPDRTRETLIKSIKQWILPGSIIMSDCWSAYASLSVELEGYTLRGQMPKYKRKDDHFDGYLALHFLCEQYHRLDERFHTFLEAVADLYPPTRTTARLED